MKKNKRAKLEASLIEVERTLTGHDLLVFQARVEMSRREAELKAIEDVIKSCFRISKVKLGIYGLMNRMGAQERIAHELGMHLNGDLRSKIDRVMNDLEVDIVYLHGKPCYKGLLKAPHLHKEDVI